MSQPEAGDRSVTLSFDQSGSVVERVVHPNGAAELPAGTERRGRRKLAARSGAAPVLKPRAAARIPTARLPRRDRRFGSGVVLVGIVYALVGIMALVLGNRALDNYNKSLGDGGPLGGGGGGGGARQLRYIELPPLPSPARRTRQPEQKRPQQPVIQPPQPVVEPLEAEIKRVEPEIPQVAILPPEGPAINVEVPGTGSGTGTGPGAGSGSGGGIGTGQGTGIGAGAGPGTGGEGGAVVAPAVRTVVYPFEDAPPEIKGKEFRVRFWVDARGRPTKVEIDPPIDDSSFRKKLLERMHQWTFYPARTLEGRPVNGQLLVTYQP